MVINPSYGTIIPACLNTNLVGVLTAVLGEGVNIGLLVPMLVQALAQYWYVYKATISHIASNKSLTELILWRTLS